MPHRDFKPFVNALGMEFLASATAKLEARVDLAGLIRAHPDEYAGVDLRGGYEEWERPIVFLVEYLTGLSETSIGDGRYVTETPWSGDVDWSATHWTYSDFDKLVRECPEADLSADRTADAGDDSEPDPNQLTLPEENE